MEETHEPRSAAVTGERVRVAGKFFRVGAAKWFARGFSYGPFPPNRDGEPLPEPARLYADFDHMRALGANLVRLYVPPPRRVLDEALARDLRVMFDLPWEKHRCFLEDRSAMHRAREMLADAACSLGNHPGLFAISVANEIPNDIVRYLGHRHVARFVDELLDLVRRLAPDCLATYVNFPTTEFLDPTLTDFSCFNVYLHDADRLGRYLDRLHHIAGDQPLLLGEYGIDTFREGEERQAELLASHVREIFHHGLAGSIVFSYTDDWFNDGRPIDEWALGVTRRDRTEKPAARRLCEGWAGLADPDMSGLPKVSVVVCTRNGSRTLDECLASLTTLRYPSYEILVVDDGSTDATAEIAARFPAVKYFVQGHAGLSAARNLGARAARGDIIAYTDDDCVADEDWLFHLVSAMREQCVAAIGGPNIAPATDGWVAHCVAAGPGNPSHVMLDDRLAEHVPGCNMAVRRDVLLGVGGFDPRFHAAGDDVDFCWRLRDAGFEIGYSPAAMVFHHRRATLGAFLRQQRGYGRAEGMLSLKHRSRFTRLGHFRWRGVIYAPGASHLLPRPVIYHGPFGTAPFQMIYRGGHAGISLLATSLEWQASAALLLAVGVFAWPAAAAGVAMMCMAAVLAFRAAARARLPRASPWWCRPLVAWLHLVQPVARGWHRQVQLMRSRRLPRPIASAAVPAVNGTGTQLGSRGLCWRSDRGVGRAALLRELAHIAEEEGWSGDWANASSESDVHLVGDWWHDLLLRTATENLRREERFTRARVRVRPTRFTWVAGAVSMVVAAVALAGLESDLRFVAVAVPLAVVAASLSSRQRCVRAAVGLVRRAGARAGLTPVTSDATRAHGAEAAPGVSSMSAAVLVPEES